MATPVFGDGPAGGCRGGQGGGWAGVGVGGLTAMLYTVAVVKLAPPPPVAPGDGISRGDKGREVTMRTVTANLITELSCFGLKEGLL